MMALMDKTLWEVISDFELRIPMSYEQFLTEIGEDIHAEWVNGETVLFMPPKPDHQRIVGFLLTLIRLYVEHLKLGDVLTAPVEMKASPAGNAREPDLLFVAQQNLHRFSETKLEGPADLVIEVVSPESARRDLDEKRLEYEAEGVAEYWVIDARTDVEIALFYVLDAAGSYRQVALDSDGTYRSTVLPGFWIDVEWLWAKPQPNTLEVFARIVGSEVLISAINQSRLPNDS